MFSKLNKYLKSESEDIVVRVKIIYSFSKLVSLVVGKKSTKLNVNSSRRQSRNHEFVQVVSKVNDGKASKVKLLFLQCFVKYTFVFVLYQDTLREHCCVGNLRDYVYNMRRVLITNDIC